MISIQSFTKWTVAEVNSLLFGLNLLLRHRTERKMYRHRGSWPYFTSNLQWKRSETSSILAFSTWAGQKPWQFADVKNPTWIEHRPARIRDGEFSKRCITNTKLWTHCNASFYTECRSDLLHRHGNKGFILHVWPCTLKTVIWIGAMFGRKHTEEKQCIHKHMYGANALYSAFHYISRQVGVIDHNQYLIEENQLSNRMEFQFF